MSNLSLSFLQNQTATASGPSGTASASLTTSFNIRLGTTDTPSTLNSNQTQNQNSLLDTPASSNETSPDSQNLLENAIRDRAVTLEIIRQLEASTSAENTSENRSTGSAGENDDALGSRLVGNITAAIVGNDLSLVAGSGGALSFVGNNSTLIGTSDSAIAISGENNSLFARDNNAIGLVGDDNTIFSGLGNTIAIGGDDNFVFSNYVIDGSRNTFSVTGNNNSVSTGRDALVTVSGENNSVEAGSNSTLIGGNGADRLSTGPDSVIDAGGGDDRISVVGRVAIVPEGETPFSAGPSASFIRVGNVDNFTELGGSTIRAGTGNDDIRVANENDVVEFNLGDGNDFVESVQGVSVNFGEGLSASDLIISREGRNITLSFATNNDTLTLDISDQATANLTFSDGERLEIAGNRAPDELTRDQAENLRINRILRDQIALLTSSVNNEADPIDRLA